MNNTKELDLCVKMDEEIISELHSKITQENIITTVQTIKQQLLDNNLDKEKVFNIYDISIEMLQNILKYSYGNRIDEDKKREADGQFIVAYDSINDKFTISSSNLITLKQVEIIQQRVDEVAGLNEKELRKLLRTKMKSKRDGHENGAGLGFSTIATKVTEPIKVNFEKILDNITKYTLTVTG